MTFTPPGARAFFILTCYITSIKLKLGVKNTSVGGIDSEEIIFNEKSCRCTKRVSVFNYLSKKQLFAIFSFSNEDV